MKLIPAFAPALIGSALLATPALAHPGHVAENSGHDHIVAAVAIILAVSVSRTSVVVSKRRARTASQSV